MAFEDTDIVVIEKGPLVGIAEGITYYPNRNQAELYVDTRRGKFETIEICRVLTRLSTVMVPQEILEGDLMEP